MKLSLAFILVLAFQTAFPVLAQQIKTTGTACSNGPETYFWEQASVCNTTSGLWQRPAYQFGAAIASCSSSTAGMVQWTGTELQYCDGTEWTEINNGQTLEDGLTVWLKFDETSGTTVTDETGNHSGTLCQCTSESRCAPTWAPTGGQFGGALYFDGAYDAFTIPASRKYTTLPMTVSVWLKLEQIASVKGDTIEFVRHYHNVDPWRRFAIVQSMYTDKFIRTYANLRMA